MSFKGLFSSITPFLQEDKSLMLDDRNSIFLSRMNPFVNIQNEFVKSFFLGIILMTGSNEIKRGEDYIMLLFTLSGTHGGNDSWGKYS